MVWIIEDEESVELDVVRLVLFEKLVEEFSMFDVVAAACNTVEYKRASEERYYVEGNRSGFLVMCCGHCCCCYLRYEIFTEHSGESAICKHTQFAHWMVLVQSGLYGWSWPHLKHLEALVHSVILRTEIDQLVDIVQCEGVE